MNQMKTYSYMKKTLFGVMAMALLAVSCGQQPSTADSAYGPVIHERVPGKYQNYSVAIYTRAYEVQKMLDSQWLDSTWNVISSQMKVDKIYLETHRDKLIIPYDDMKRVKEFFESKGVRTAGGITYTISEPNSFETYCYQDPEERKAAQEIIELTASLFDEVVLDDFFFIDCKCEYCLEAKGDRSWEEYRLDLMHDAAINVVIDPARKVNPNCEVVIKYPNWYDHFAALGFDLDFGPKHFAGVYTGTETRDRVTSNQHLQPYLSYNVWRYYDNLQHSNRGGWVDTGGMRYIDRYSEQIWMTMFAKSPEMTLFDYRQMLNPIRPSHRAPWQGQGTSFDFDEMMKPVNYNGKEVTPSTVARAAGFTLEKLDRTIGFLGNPVGIKSYKPFPSSGEEFLQNYLGQIGLPIEMVPEYPENEFVLLTEQASFDKDILKKIDATLRGGHDVMITSGFLRAMQGRGIENMFELKYTDRKTLATGFMTGGQILPVENPILMQQIMYQTNDSWEMISGMNSGLGWPLLHRYLYSENNLYLLVIPDNFADLYNLPVPVLNQIRALATGKVSPVTFEGAADICLYVYDNNTFIIQSLRDEASDVRISVAAENVTLTDLLKGSTVEASRGVAQNNRRGNQGRSSSFNVTLKPHSYKVFRF